MGQGAPGLHTLNAQIMRAGKPEMTPKRRLSRPPESRGWAPSPVRVVGALKACRQAADMLADSIPLTGGSCMDSISGAAVAQASSTDLSSRQGAAAVLVLKKALNLEAASVATLILALPAPALATAGNLGTRVNTCA